MALSDDNYKTGTVGTLTITQKEVGLTWSDNDTTNTTDFSFVYTGSAVSVTATATGLIDNDTCDVTVTDGAKIDASAYTATATALSNGNYKLPNAVTQAYTIAKAPVTFAVSENSHIYDANEKTATVTQDTGVSMATDGTDFTVSYDPSEPTDVGTYDIYVEIKDSNFMFSDDTTIAPQVSDSNTTTYSWTFTPKDSNYATKTGFVTLLVNPKAITITAEEVLLTWASNPTYNGTVQSMTATVDSSSLVGTDEVTVTTYSNNTLSYSDTPQAAGTYSVTATLSDSVNFYYSNQSNTDDTKYAYTFP